MGWSFLIAAKGFAEDLTGAVGDDFVGVHMQADPGSGLKDIDDEVVVVLAVDDLLRRLLDGASLLRGDEAKRLIGFGGSVLNHRQCADEKWAGAQAADGEVRDGAGGLGSVERVCGNFDGAEGVGFGSRGIHATTIRCNP